MILKQFSCTVKKQLFGAGDLHLQFQQNPGSLPIFVTVLIARDNPLGSLPWLTPRPIDQFQYNRAAAAGLSCSMNLAISSRSRSACFTFRKRKILLPLGLHVDMIDAT
jgi:hypothetical protein